MSKTGTGEEGVPELKQSRTKNYEDCTSDALAFQADRYDSDKETSIEFTSDPTPPLPESEDGPKKGEGVLELQSAEPTKLDDNTDAPKLDDKTDAPTPAPPVHKHESSNVENGGETLIRRRLNKALRL